MAKITIRFVTEKDFISAAIRLETWSSFSHVEFVLDDGTTLGARSDGGVQIRPLGYTKFASEEWYQIEVTDAEKKAILDAARAQVGKKYDYSDIMGILFRRDWRAQDKWICSELVAYCFEKGGLPLVHAPLNRVNRITPGILYLSPWLDGNQVLPSVALAAMKAQK